MNSWTKQFESIFFTHVSFVLSHWSLFFIFVLIGNIWDTIFMKSTTNWQNPIIEPPKCSNRTTLNRSFHTLDCFDVVYIPNLDMQRINIVAVTNGISDSACSFPAAIYFLWQCRFGCQRGNCGERVRLTLSPLGRFRTFFTSVPSTFALPDIEAIQRPIWQCHCWLVAGFRLGRGHNKFATDSDGVGGWWLVWWWLTNVLRPRIERKAHTQKKIDVC